MLIIGIFGTLLSLASVILLGADITDFINVGLPNHSGFKFTKILDVMHRWTPDFWAQTVNYINGEGASFSKTATEFCVNLPACIIGLLFGFGLVLIGFRVQSYHKN
ncbi:MAG: hypothetical protein KBA75_08860 [Alphaproteobacteria bacterium]|nr:hypothetical protein [Alphaproteobacteria bacterium]